MHPGGVDVQLHRPYGSSRQEHVGQGLHRELAGGVDDVPAGIDADPRTPHEGLVAGSEAPANQGILVQVGGLPAVVDEEDQVLADGFDVRPHGGVPAPEADVYGSVLVDHERRLTVDQRVSGRLAALGVVAAVTVGQT